MVELFKKTVAYKIILGDKTRGQLSHAYALVCEDCFTLNAFIKIVAKMLLCDSADYCDQCRSCRLIEKGTHSDVTFYPKTAGGKILTGDIDELIAQTYIKPVESEKRVFALVNTASMNGSAQNKLLKTLEEPPKNVFIVMGIENENAILPTVKSRIKKLEIPSFSDEDLLEGLQSVCPDKEKLAKAVSFAEGKAGVAVEYYNEEKGLYTEEFVYNLLKEMKSSREVSSFACKIDKDNIKEFLVCLKKTMSSIVRRYSCGGGSSVIEELSQIYKLPSALAIIEKVNLAERALYYNGNVNVVTDGILLSILEEKYRWQKL